MAIWSDAFDFAFRLLAGMNILLLLILFLAIGGARKRQNRVEKKIDMIGKAAGLSAEFGLLDSSDGRETGLAALHDFPDSTPGR
jgi:hypothetical protein